MPLAIERPAPTGLVQNDRRARAFGLAERSARTIEIGLVNNMPDAAVAATQRQFARLIEDASDDLDVRLSLFALDTLPRDDAARRAMADDYAPARSLNGAKLDALIVTGAEPQAADLRQEAYWDELGFVLDWAADNTISSLLSCLAAHAAVLRSDGIVRRPLSNKRTGVFAIDIVADHALVAGLEPRYLTPHSRWNDLDEAKLVEKGYRVLSRSSQCGADIFVRKARSLLVHLQGHPEYEADSLAREHRRDLLRFLRGERTPPPNPPFNYYSPEAAAEVADFARRAMAAPEAALAGGFPVSALAPKNEPWRPSALQFANNWLAMVARRKAARSAATFAVARWGG
jgi:homoserine O-succinyltransferase